MIFVSYLKYNCPGRVSLPGIFDPKSGVCTPSITVSTIMVVAGRNRQWKVLSFKC